MACRRRLRKRGCSGGNASQSGQKCAFRQRSCCGCTALQVAVERRNRFRASRSGVSRPVGLRTSTPDVNPYLNRSNMRSCFWDRQVVSVFGATLRPAFCILVAGRSLHKRNVFELHLLGLQGAVLRLRARQPVGNAPLSAVRGNLALSTIADVLAAQTVVSGTGID